MHCRLASYLMDERPYFSIMIDESVRIVSRDLSVIILTLRLHFQTDRGGVQHMIIYVRTTHNGQPVSFFWGLKKVSKSTRADDLTEDLLNALLARDEKLIGLDESYLGSAWLDLHLTEQEI